MKTALTSSPIEAARIIRSGGLVAFPTETVFGLGANVYDEAAVARIFEAKMRPQDNPLIAHIGGPEQIGLLAAAVTSSARRLIDAFFPGPLTVILPKRSEVPMIATAGLDSIGIRMPRHGLARRFLVACGTPVVAPSANLSGRPSPTTWQAVLEDLGGRIDCILKGEPTEFGVESTVVDCRGPVPFILRKGAVTLEQLKTIVPETAAANETLIHEARSPGLKHKHYSPKAKVVAVSAIALAEVGQNAAHIGPTLTGRSFDLELIVPSVDEYAHSLFEFFRECDRRGIETIYCEEVDEAGIGAALMDRIRRAAEK